MSDVKNEFCLPNSSEDCYHLFGTILKNQKEMLDSQRIQGEDIKMIRESLLGNEFHKGHLDEFKDLQEEVDTLREDTDRRLKIIETAYIRVGAIIAVAAFLIMNLPKIITALKT